jgi:integrase
MAEKAKTIKLDRGTVYQKTANGSYYFRYQINGQRKAVSLKTKNQKEAIAKAKELLPVVNATSTEVISAHVSLARNLTSVKENLPLSHAWELYSQHPERATPATVHQQKSYMSTFLEFIDFIDNEQQYVADITPEIAEKFCKNLKASNISVHTHNRKIKRLKKIFDILQDYRDQNNPFSAQSLRRKEREEQADIPKRLSFTRKQEQQLLNVLEDVKYKVMNKPEVRVIYHLGMFTGQRMKDCVLLRWDKVDLNRRRIWVKQFKTGKEVTIPIAPKLLEVLKEAQEWQTNHYVCPNVAQRYNKVDAKGKNTGNNLVNIDMLRVIKWIGLEPSVEVPGRKKKVTVYGFHSLRHSFVSHCAEAGVPKAVVLSIIGANSEIVDKHYTHIGEEAQEKAIMAISGTYTSISDRERIEKALAIIKDFPNKTEILCRIEAVLLDK